MVLIGGIWRQSVNALLVPVSVWPFPIKILWKILLAHMRPPNIIWKKRGIDLQSVRIQCICSSIATNYPVTQQYRAFFCSSSRIEATFHSGSLFWRILGFSLKSYKHINHWKWARLLSPGIIFLPGNCLSNRWQNASLPNTLFFAMDKNQYMSWGLGDTELAKRRAINLYTSSLSKGAQSLYVWAPAPSAIAQ